METAKQEPRSKNRRRQSFAFFKIYYQNKRKPNGMSNLAIEEVIKRYQISPQDIDELKQLGQISYKYVEKDIYIDTDEIDEYFKYKCGYQDN